MTGTVSTTITSSVKSVLAAEGDGRMITVFFVILMLIGKKKIFQIWFRI